MNSKLRISFLLIALTPLPLVSAAELNKQKLITKPSRGNIETKQKTPNSCKAFENAIRNIRTVKELQRELNNHSEETIKQCIKIFQNDRRIMTLFKQLDKIKRSK